MAKWGEDAHSAQKSSPRRSHCCHWGVEITIFDSRVCMVNYCDTGFTKKQRFPLYDSLGANVPDVYRTPYR